jgi:hypothetical protein
MLARMSTAGLSRPEKRHPVIDDKTNDPNPMNNRAPVESRAVLPTIVVRDSASAPSYALARPDPFFVTQLIATAIQVPQTRTLRRASPEDARISYKSTIDQSMLQMRARTMRSSRIA